MCHQGKAGNGQDEGKADQKVERRDPVPAYLCRAREKVVVADQNGEGGADERQERREQKNAHDAELDGAGSHVGISGLRLR